MRLGGNCDRLGGLLVGVIRMFKAIKEHPYHCLSCKVLKAKIKRFAEWILKSGVVSFCAKN